MWVDYNRAGTVDKNYHHIKRILLFALEISWEAEIKVSSVCVCVTLNCGGCFLFAELVIFRVKLRNGKIGTAWSRNDLLASCWGFRLIQCARFLISLALIAV